MRARWSKLVAVLLAVMFTGATHACMCAGMGEVAAARMSADPHACCKRGGDQAPARPLSGEDPCKNCNAQHPLAITVPGKVSTAPAPDLAGGLSAIELPLAHILVAPVDHTSAENIPIPPLLRDLVHTSCQLTV